MEENNLIEVELLESDEVNVPSETVTSNVVPQDNSQQSEKTGEIVKNKGKKSSFVIGVIFVVLVIGVMIALGSYNNDIIEKNNLRDDSSSVSDYSSVSSSSSVDSNYDYSNDNSYNSDYDSDYSYNSSYDSDYDSDYDYSYDYDSYDSDYDYSYDSGYDDYSYGSSDYEYFPGCYGLPKPDSVVSNIYYKGIEDDVYEYVFYSDDALIDYGIELAEFGYLIEKTNRNSSDGILLYTIENDSGTIEAFFTVTYVDYAYHMYVGIM